MEPAEIKNAWEGLEASRAAVKEALEECQTGDGFLAPLELLVAAGSRP